MTMLHHSNVTNNFASGGNKPGNPLSGCLTLILILALGFGFISLGPNKLRDPLCKVSHIAFFCRGIIDVQPIQIGPDTLNVGLSEGNYAFDVREPGGQYKQQAVVDMNAGHMDDAAKNWQRSIDMTTDDAESMIYLENKVVTDSHKPYITIVVTTTLSQIIDDSSTSLSVARDDLRGAYWAQREFNAQHPNRKLRIVLANLGVKAPNYLQTSEEPVLQQIARLAQTDATFVGVVGFPFSSSARIAINALKDQHIPIISPSASSKDLSHISPYFFRIVPSDIQQGKYAAQFVSQILSKRRVAVLSDAADAYSGSLGDSFATSFSQLNAKNNIVAKNFSLNNADSLNAALNSILSQRSAPEMIYFTGYANDLNNLKNLLAQRRSTIAVMGGDASYELGAYNSGNYKNFYFSAFTYPDTWNVLCPTSKKCATLRPTVSDNTLYEKTFDPGNQHVGQYGYARMGAHVLLMYDATRALEQAADAAIQSSNNNISLDIVRNALQQVSFQGASGQISFDGSDPANKSLLILCVDHTHRTQMAQVYGQFAIGEKKFLLDPGYIQKELCA